MKNKAYYLGLLFCLFGRALYAQISGGWENYYSNDKVKVEYPELDYIVEKWSRILK